MPRSSNHDTAVLPGSRGWPGTVVLLPSRASASPGWYSDPYDIGGLRYWDGGNWTNHSSVAVVAHPTRARRSVLLAFVLAFFLGGLALPYALPIPWWGRLLLAGALAFTLGWWLLLFIPLTWPFALVLVPLITVAFNPGR